MDWMHGYYAQTGYSHGYYAETMPVRLRWASLLHGHIVPDRNFRYLDAGCGQGINLLIAAAMHPESEFVGIDFMPEHIVHARRIAERCGIDNVTLIEGDFLEIARDPGMLGEFDMAVCHGITTWIAPDIKQGLFSLIGQTLKPGGVFYNSYNTHPGWLGTVPFQHLVRVEQRTKSGIDAVNAARETMDKLHKASERLFAALPTLPTRLKTLDGHNPAYLTQEYGNHHWQPVFVTQMMDDMSAVKLDFLGTATLSDAFDRLIDANVREVMQAQPSVALRELMRDYAFIQSFRRDLYVKGKPTVWEIELADALRSTKIISNPLIARPTDGEPYKIKATMTELAGNAEYYNALLAKIDAHPTGITVGDMIEGEAERGRQNTMVETLSMMLHGGWISLSVPAPNPRGPEISVALAGIGCQGGPYRDFPFIATGTAARLSDTDMILTKLVGEGVPRDELPAKMMDALGKLRRQLAKDGKPITDEAERDVMRDKLVVEFFENKLPFFKAINFL